jgi:hypothetical protein
MKQSYDKGAVIFLRKLPGIFEYNGLDGTLHFEQDKGSTYDHIYIASRYRFSGIPHHSSHIHKIDIKDAVPK